MYRRVLVVINIQTRICVHSSSTMGKNRKSASEGKSKNTSEKKSSKSDIKGAVYLGNNNEVILKIHAKPGAKESAITDIGSEAVGVQIGAPPVDGEANKELIRYLAEVLKLRKSDLSLDKGSRSKEKVVVISKDISLVDVLEMLSVASKQ